MQICGLPVILMVVPFLPVPLPRKTTPLALIINARSQLNVPALSNTAPRTPPTMGSLETESMAFWITAAPSASEGLTVARTGTVGILTPPPP
jgi:hypothetical protein